MQRVILVCGVPGSGKTTFAKTLADGTDYVHLDIDDFYAKINGDSKDRSNKFEVWQEFFRQIHLNQQAGNSVIVDTMALTAYDRREFVEWFPEFDEHVLVFIDAPCDVCIKNVSKRARTIPEDVIRKYYNRVEIPTPSTDSKWDRTLIYRNDGERVAMAMRFVPYEKMSKKQKREYDEQRRMTWGERSPVTRFPKCSNAYNRNKEKENTRNDTSGISEI